MTLHIVNGDSTAGTLRRSSLKGAVFSFADALTSGPALANVDKKTWRAIRASHLSTFYGVDLDECKQSLLQQELALESFSQHEEVILWFEQDLFCQINLLSLLDWFSRVERGRTRLSLINIGTFPGHPNFRGLGELNEQELSSLFPKRQPVTTTQLRLASAAWQAFCSPNPTRIERFLNCDTSEFTFLDCALTAHLRRFPSVKNGLGHVEETTVSMVQDGIQSFSDLFLRFGDIAPIYGFGDLQIWSTLISLSGGRRPLLRFETGEPLDPAHASPRAKFELTDEGYSVLAGTADYAKLNDVDLWLGGTHLTNDLLWRWNEHTAKLEYQQRERDGH